MVNKQGHKGKKFGDFKILTVLVKIQNQISAGLQTFFLKVQK